MPNRMVQIGARIPQEDAEFISHLRIEGASTPSDKLRVIVAEARRRHEGGGDYATALELARDQLDAVTRRQKRSEFEAGVHSELLARLLEWMPDTLAYLISAERPAPDADPLPSLVAFERGAADRVFRLLEVVLQLAVTRRPQCYDPTLFDERISPVLELAGIIDQARNPDPQER